MQSAFELCGGFDKCRDFSFVANVDGFRADFSARCPQVVGYLLRKAFIVV